MSSHHVAWFPGRTWVPCDCFSSGTEWGWVCVQVVDSGRLFWLCLSRYYNRQNIEHGFIQSISKQYENWKWKSVGPLLRSSSAKLWCIAECYPCLFFCATYETKFFLFFMHKLITSEFSIHLFFVKLKWESRDQPGIGSSVFGLGCNWVLFSACLLCVAQVE